MIECRCMHTLATLSRSAAVLKAPQLDTQLLTLLVEMAALETEGAGGMGNVVVMTIELKQDFGALKSEHTLGELAGRMWTSQNWSCGVNWIEAPSCNAEPCGRQRKLDIRRVDFRSSE